MDVRKIGEKLRSAATYTAAAGDEDVSDAFDALADWIESQAPSEPEPEQHWIGPFDWHGGKRAPVPDGVRVVWDGYGDYDNWQRPGRFYYCTDNPEGWIERPANWVPPDEAWPLKWSVVHIVSEEYGDSEYLRREAWDRQPAVRWFRLLPREQPQKPKPEPVAWAFLGHDGSFTHVTLVKSTAEWWQGQEGGRVVPLMPLEGE